MDLFNLVTLTIGILTLIASCIAIWVALYLGRKSSEDCKRMIVSHKENSDTQINEIRLASRNEIKEFRTLIHAILTSAIHCLDNENKILAISSKEANHKYLELLRRYKEIKNWESKEKSTISVDEINNHINLLEESILELKADYECNKKAADNINILLNHFISLDKQLFANR